MTYDRQQYLDDGDNPEMPHIKSREHFKNFYDELGRDPIQQAQESYIDEDFWIKASGSVIELGCHWGFNLMKLAVYGHKCVGIDVSDTLIEHGKKKLKEYPEAVQNNVTLIQGFIEDYMPPHKFDTVILTETLEHVIDPDKVMAKAVECLSEDGLIYISTPDHRVGTYAHVRGFNRDEMEALVLKHGLEVVEFVSVGNSTTAVIAKLRKV